MQPGTEVLNIELQPVLIVVSGENLKAGETDTSNEDNRSRQRTYNVWDDEEEEEY